MKRVVMIAVIMAVITSLFAFSVSAASPAILHDYSATAAGSNVSIKLRAVQFQAISVGTSMLASGMETHILVTCEIQNTNSDAAIVNPVLFDLTTSSARNITGIEILSSDLELVKETYFKVVPSSDFSYDGMIVVPPDTTLYLIAVVCIDANMDQTGQTIQQTQLQGIDFVGTGSSYIVGHGNYPYGMAVDMSEVVDAIDSVDVDLDTLINLVTFTGSYSAPSVNSAGSSTSDFTDSDTGIRYYLRTIVSPSYILSYDFEVEGSTDQVYSGGTKRYVITQIGRIYIPSSSTYQYGTMSIKEPIVSDSSHRPYVVSVMSNFVSSAYVYGSSVTLINEQPSDLSTARFILAPGQNYFVIQYYLDVPIGYNATITSLSNSTNAFTIANLAQYTGDSSFSISIKSAINVIKNRVTDIYRSLTTSEAQDNTAEAQEMNDDIHDAEQVWYDNNSIALEQVGLSNYRFSTSQSSGISQAVTQFQAVWNALGDWTNVYIFILILSVSTYIIRHEPTTRVKQYRSSVAAERAERISYYGHKNAESRASASSGSTLKNAIRRRK